MAYRDARPENAPVCPRHPAALAVETCEAGAQPICEPCLVYVSARAHCWTCAQQARRRHVLRLFVIGTVLLGAWILLVRSAIKRAGCAIERPKR